MTGNGSKTLRRYNLRTEKGAWLGMVVISDDGYFSTVSDYGNYAYWWGHAEMEFRAFLCQLEPDYLCSKLAPGRVYYGEPTERDVRRTILTSRRRMDLTREEAREEWDHLEESDLGAPEGFAIWYQGTKLHDAHELAHYGTEPQAVAFAERVWPALVAALRAELAAEATVSP